MEEKIILKLIVEQDMSVWVGFGWYWDFVNMVMNLLVP